MSMPMLAMRAMNMRLAMMVTMIMVIMPAIRAMHMRMVVIMFMVVFMSMLMASCGRGIVAIGTCLRVEGGADCFDATTQPLDHAFEHMVRLQPQPACPIAVTHLQGYMAIA